MTRLALAIILLFTFTQTALGAEVRAVVDRTRISLGESVQLTVSTSGSMAEVDVSPIKDFNALSRGTSTSVQIVNGRMTREVKNNYTLIPLKEGRLRIPSLKVVSDGKTYQTREIEVQVSKQSRQPEQANNVFARARVSNPHPYQGEQIVYTFQFFTSVQIANAKFQQPDFSGFVAKEIEDRKTYRQVISGIEFQVTELGFVLVPVGSGEKTIEPAVLQCDIVRRVRGRRSPLDSFFNDPFFGRTQMEPRLLRTQPIAVAVKPLPPFTGTGSFSGLVGTFDIRAELETDILKAGDSTTLTVEIEGTGNIMDAEKPEIRVPDPFKDRFKVYEDAPEEDIRLEPSGYSGKKTFRIALVPIEEGEYTLDPVRFSYFDIQSGKYVTRTTGPFSLTVQPAEKKDKLEVFASPTETGGVPKILKKKVEFTGRDILPLKEGLDALNRQDPMPLFRFILLLIIPAVVFIGLKAFFTLTRKDELPAKKMADRAEKALKDAEKADISNEVFLSSLYRALVSIILSRSGAMGESLTWAEAKEILSAGGCPDETVDRAAGLLERIESSRYSGLQLDQTKRTELLAETRQLFRSLSG
jgi:hypothetical protein